MRLPRSVVVGFIVFPVLFIGQIVWKRIQDVRDDRATVLDGDTIKIGSNIIRLYGVDSLEIDQSCTTERGALWPCGVEAKLTLQRLIAGQPVTCTVRDTDRYGRTVATCEVGGIDLGREMVRLGMAVVYRRYTRENVDAENEAKAARRGIWDSTFVEPATWRRNRR